METIAAIAHVVGTDSIILKRLKWQILLYINYTESKLCRTEHIWNKKTYTQFSEGCLVSWVRDSCFLICTEPHNGERRSLSPVHAQHELWRCFSAGVVTDSSQRTTDRSQQRTQSPHIINTSCCVPLGFDWRHGDTNPRNKGPTLMTCTKAWSVCVSISQMLWLIC